MDDIDWIAEDIEFHTDFNHLKQKHTIHGFREGISKGHDYILQNAFNDGFEVAAKYFERLSRYRGRLSAIYMFLMNHPSCTEKIGKQIELLIRNIEDLENEKKHIFILSEVKNTQNKTETVYNVTEENSRNFVEEDSTMDSLVDSFDSLQHQSEKCNSLREDDQSSCCKNGKGAGFDSNCSSIEERKVSPVEINKKTNEIDDHLSKELEKMYKIILGSIPDILENFDESLKNKVMGQLNRD